MSVSISLAGKVALITGGGRGIGKAITRARISRRRRADGLTLAIIY